MPGAAAQRDLQFMLSGFDKLAAEMQRQKHEKMARDILARTDPNYNGTDDPDIYETLQEKQMNRKLKEAQIAKALREPKRGTDYVDTEYGQMTPYQAATLSLRQARTGDEAPNSTPPSDANDPPEGYITDRLGNLHPDKTFVRQNPRTNSLHALDSEVKAATGSPIAAWLQSNNHRMLNEQGQGDNNGGIFAADYTDPSGQTTTLKAPRSLYEKYLHGTMDSSRTVGSTPVQPSANGAPATKPLDPDTAKSILAETGGDKDKAREVARQRGYSF